MKIVPAAGKVTKVMPCTSPARLTTRVSAFDAIPVGSAALTPTSAAVTVSSDCPSALIPISSSTTPPAM